MNNYIQTLLLIAGSIIILYSVLKALSQHDIIKLLSYDGMSQAGFIVLGIASGTALGLAGAVFHLINSIIYLTGLFLTAVSIKQKAGHTNLDKLGGVSNYMPITFACTLIFSLSISGVPPLNGFISKWMIYQALIGQLGNTELTVNARLVYLVMIVAALLGSSLTFASFVKLMHSVYLGQNPYEKSEMKKKFSEVSFTKWFPSTLLASLCVIFGIFAFPIVIEKIILPVVSKYYVSLPKFMGFWQPATASLLIISGLIFGFIVYILFGIKTRTDFPFVGGEKLEAENRILGVDLLSRDN